MRASQEATRLRTAGWGLAIIAAYIVSAVLTLGSGRMPLRPFFEGTAPPQPYAWVVPPEALKAQNVPPKPGEGVVKFTKKGSSAGNVGTDDGQAMLALTEGSIEAAAGETEVKVTIQPLDAKTLGPPPQGLSYDGNAYRVAVTYPRSGKPAVFAAKDCPVGAQPKLCPTMVMRYAYGATGLYRREGSAWTAVPNPTPVQQGLQIFADVASDGTYVAAGPPRAETATPSRVGDYVAIALGVVAIVGGIVASRTTFFKRRWRRRKKRRKQRLKAKARTQAARGPAKKYKKPPKTYGKKKR